MLFMNGITVNKTGLLRVKYLDAIEGREDEIFTLREKLALLDEVESDSRSLAVTPNTPGKYTVVKLTKAVLSAVREIARNGGVRASAVQQYIAANGYRHRGKHFAVATRVVLIRLTKRGKLISKKKDGKRVFMVKPE